MAWPSPARLVDLAESKRLRAQRLAERREKVLQLAREGLPPLIIAQRMGVTAQAVRTWLKGWGATPSQAGGGHG